ncbi:MAG: hypothetical protein Q9174_004910 [Haloplaca sp. 1 TL-2023]
MHPTPFPLVLLTLTLLLTFLPIFTAALPTKNCYWTLFTGADISNGCQPWPPFDKIDKRFLTGWRRNPYRDPTTTPTTPSIKTTTPTSSGEDGNVEKRGNFIIPGIRKGQPPSAVTPTVDAAALCTPEGATATAPSVEKRMMLVHWPRKRPCTVTATAVAESPTPALVERGWLPAVYWYNKNKRPSTPAAAATPTSTPTAPCSVQNVEKRDLDLEQSTGRSELTRTPIREDGADRLEKRPFIIPGIRTPPEWFNRASPTGSSVKDKSTIMSSCSARRERSAAAVETTTVSPEDKPTAPEQGDEIVVEGGVERRSQGEGSRGALIGFGDEEAAQDGATQEKAKIRRAGTANGEAKEMVRNYTCFQCRFSFEAFDKRCPEYCNEKRSYRADNDESRVVPRSDTANGGMDEFSEECRQCLQNFEGIWGSHCCH